MQVIEVAINKKDASELLEIIRLDYDHCKNLKINKVFQPIN